jgi:hypothetical protein
MHLIQWVVKMHFSYVDFEDIDPFFEPFSDAEDIYAKGSVDLLMDNDGITLEEAGFMDGYNEAV